MPIRRLDEASWVRPSTKTPSLDTVFRRPAPAPAQLGRPTMFRRTSGPPPLPVPQTAAMSRRLPKRSPPVTEIRGALVADLPERWVREDPSGKSWGSMLENNRLWEAPLEEPSKKRARRTTAEFKRERRATACQKSLNDLPVVPGRTPVEVMVV